MAVLNRKKFIEYAEANWSTVIYTITDCQQFVEDAAKAAGYTFNSAGSNDMWRNYLKAKGNTKTFDLAPGDVLFKYYEPGHQYYDLPARYANHAEQRDIHHVGILTSIDGNTYTVCHSSGVKVNGKKDVFTSKEALAKTWPLAGTLKNTNSWIWPENEKSVATIQISSVGNCEKRIWDFLISKNLNPFAAAGIMGNLYAESSLNELALSKKFDQQQYFSNFDAGLANYKDGCAMGIAQWCHWSRKENLYKYLKKNNKSAKDLDAQLEFLWQELQTYKTVMNTLKSAKSIQEASDIFLTGFEKPANQGATVKSLRARYGQIYYDRYAVTSTSIDTKTIQVLVTGLRYRAGAGTNYTILGSLVKNKTYKISRMDNDWGYITSLNAWCSLNPSYVKFLS